MKARQKLRAKMSEAHVHGYELAAACRISTKAFSQKMTKKESFTEAEMAAIAEYLNIPPCDVWSIITS